MRELEVKAEQAEKESKIVRKDQVDRLMSLVPRFDGTEIEKYFLMFEKAAESMEWPQDIYCLFLQGVLTGKVKDVYCALSTQQCANDEFVKDTIQQPYELVLEAYRQRFRNLVNQGNQTYVRFAHDKENACDRWLSAIKVLLVEEFKTKVNTDVKFNLDEQEDVDLKTAAVMAEDYALTHRKQEKNGFSHKAFTVKKQCSS